MVQNNIIEKAAKIGAVAHKEQVRKDDSSPYIVHPFLVALNLVKYDFPDAVVVAGLLHDVLEDTDVLEKTLLAEFGEEVLETIKALSEDKSLEWEDRKKQYIETIRDAPESVKAVSVCDKIHNLGNFITALEKEGPLLWKKFSRGKEQQLWFMEELLKMFKETWKHPLVDEFEMLVAEFRKIA